VFLNGTELRRFPPIRFRPGDELELRLPGAGGFGPPSERDAPLVLSDVENGYVSVEAARTAYEPENLHTR
jgi:N-methylhydantoinase B/oxoprolinase/acetone carboxylase alpha subunit